MIFGHKPSGYFATADGEGHKIEGETRQCIHCQYTWEYRPGSGVVRGYCGRCHGFVCARDECIKKQIELTGNTTDCLPFEIWNNKLQDKIERAKKELGVPGIDFTVSQDGLIVPAAKQ